MRVVNNNVDQLASGAAEAVANSPAETKSPNASAAPPDSVRLSNATNLVALAKAGAASRQAKIESVGQQVRSGSYTSDTAQVSHAVVQDHLGNS